MVNTLFIRRRNKVWVPEGTDTLPVKYVSALLRNIEPLGFTFSKALIDQVSRLSVEALEPFYIELIRDLRLLVGAHVPHEPMYPNFPQQVMEASEAELYFNAILHYLGDLTNTRIFPFYNKDKREPLQDSVKLRVLEAGSAEEFQQIFTQLLQSKSSLSETDKGDVEWFIRSYKNDIMPMVPSVIPHKENAALAVARILEYTTVEVAFAHAHVHTATDVLRVAVAMSRGDVSLAENTRFRNFARRERRLLLELLENGSPITEDMLRYREVWLRLGERLHPFEFKNKFPASAEAFDVLRNNKPYRTFNSQVEEALHNRDVAVAVALLQRRPGELARRLDHLLRIAHDPGVVLAAFKVAAATVSSPVLLQVLTHFAYRNADRSIRVFFPKGDAGKAQAIPNTLPFLKEEVCTEVCALCKDALIDRYRKLPALGKVYVEQGLHDFTVPFSQRSASKALKTVSRGSKLALPDGNTIRFFLWWREGQGRADIDLSAVGLDSSHILREQITYYNLQSLGGGHSGDITSAPEGASEFIDIDITRFREAGIRYVLISINSFTQQPFCDLPECFAGFMVRQFPNSGEIYEPSTVENKIDITSNTRACIPLMIDLDERIVIWTDLALTQLPEVNNVAGTSSTLSILSQAMTSLVKTSLYDLFTLHAEARGQQVFEKDKADTIFGVHEGLTPFDTEKILSEYL